MVDQRCADKPQFLQGAADGYSEEAEAAAEDGAPEMCNAEAAAEMADLPSSSNRAAAHLQQAVQTKQKRIALPEHARLATGLQVSCDCPSLAWRTGSA